jgi:hypothetical protein
MTRDPLAALHKVALGAPTKIMNIIFTGVRKIVWFLRFPFMAGVGVATSFPFYLKHLIQENSLSIDEIF